jgi:hypothetical protein
MTTARRSWLGRVAFALMVLGLALAGWAQYVEASKVNDPRGTGLWSGDFYGQELCRAAALKTARVVMALGGAGVWVGGTIIAPRRGSRTEFDEA